ncbi:MAG: hypothetical protein R3F49_08460 [Planctomycetota bacterium]
MHHLTALALSCATLSVVASAQAMLPASTAAAAPVAAQDADAKQDAAVPAKAAWKGEPYMLATCAASWRPLDVKGTRTTMVVEGQELKFCCGGCGDVVAKDPAKWVEKVNAAHADQQRPIYPMKTCVISGEALFDADGKDTATEVVVQNRLFRVCCPSCAKAVKADPGKYAALLDAEVLKSQAKAYPVGTCVVNPKAEVSADSEQFVVAGRLVRTCCARCKAKVLENPYEYIVAIDAARAAATGGAAPAKGAAEGAGHEHGEKHGEKKGE